MHYHALTYCTIPKDCNSQISNCPVIDLYYVDPLNEEACNQIAHHFHISWLYNNDYDLPDDDNCI